MIEFLNYIFHSNVINFILVAYFLYWLLFKKLDVIKFFEEQSEKVKSSIKNSENKKNDAINYLGQTKESLKNVDNDVAKIVADAEDIAKTIEEKSQTKLDAELSNLENRTNILKEAHESKAKEEVSRKIAMAAVAISKEYIENALDENAHRDLIYNFISDLDEMRVDG